MMARSRMTRIKSRRATIQALIYIFISVLIIIGMIAWGVPAVARLAGLLITEDTGIGGINELKPTPPIFSDIPEATNSNLVDLSGFAQPGVEVTLYVNGAEYKNILSDDAGVFEFKKVPLVEGDNNVYAFATTNRGTDSEQSKAYTIKVDKEGPEMTLSSPQDGEVYRGETQRIVEFQGIVAEDGSRVTIGDRVAIVQTDGSFKLQYQLAEGDQTIEIKAVDHAENETVKSVTLRFEP